MDVNIVAADKMKEDGFLQVGRRDHGPAGVLKLKICFQDHL